jgi:predicted DNA-binding transcriptional regulator AlpA
MADVLFSESESTPETFMTVRDVALLLRKSEAWVYRNSRSGVLPTILVGRSRWFTPDDINRWIGDRRQ